MRAIVIAVIAGISSPAVAADRDAASAKEDKIICKRVQDMATGSHFPVTRKTCMKRSEWKELADETDRVMRKVREPRRDPNAALPAMGGAPQ